MRTVSEEKGVTLIELLVAFAICGMVLAAIYRLFIDQSKVYTVQDQVVEIQQSLRSTMEVLMRDIRMAGFDDDNLNSTVTISDPVVYPIQESAVTVNYEYYDKQSTQYQRHTVSYWRDGNASTLIRQATVNDVAGPQEVILENVDGLNFSYGIDENDDGAMDDLNGNNQIDEGDWVPAASVGLAKVVAVRVNLMAKPDQTNEEVRKWVVPRILTSAVTLRNLCLKR